MDIGNDIGYDIYLKCREEILHIPCEVSDDIDLRIHLDVALHVDRNVHGDISIMINNIIEDRVDRFLF